MINSSDADIYLSIHMNYLNDSSYNGTTIFYFDDETLANTIQDSVNNYYGYNKTISNIPTGTYMYSKLSIPGVLIECGFLSNENDRENFQNDDYIEEFTNIIANSLINYF